MSTIVTRSGKGSPLTHSEMDANITNLNNDKLESTVTQDLTIKTSDGGILKLQTSHDTIEDGDVLGAIEFSAPDESDDTDARTTAASIVAEANDTFATDANEADLVFKLGDSGTATEVMRLTESSFTMDRTELILTQDNSGNLYGPVLTFNRVSTSPSDDDRGGQLLWKFENDADQTIDWSYIRYVFTDVTDGSEDGQWEFVSKVDGTNTDALILTGNSATFGGSLTTSGDITAKTSDGAILKLQTSHDSIADGDVLGAIEFSAPDEADGSDGDARLLAASIVAEADATFDDTVNKTDLVIKLGKSEAATERGRFKHEGGLTLTGYDTDANPDPSLQLMRDTASPADNDFIGNIYFQGKNSTDNYFTYAAILAVSEDVTDGTEDGQLIFRVGEGGNEAWSGSANNLITLTPDKIYFDASNGTNFGLHGIEDVSTLRLTGTNDVTLSSTNHGFQIGSTSGTNLAVDTNEIMARNNGGTSTLHLNANGGYVSCGGGLIINGNNAIVYEGATEDDYETFVYATDPTADRYIYFPNASGTVLVQDTSNDVTIEASTSTSGVDPTITFYKNDTSSGADGDGLAAINFKGKNSSGGSHSYSWISSGIVTASSGSEEGRLQLKVAGSNSNYQNEAYSGQNGLEIRNDKTQVKGNLLVDGVIDSSERTLLVTTTVSDASSVDFNSTYITDTYNTYDVVFTNIHSASDNVALRCRMGDSDSAITSATYSYIGQMRGTRGSDSTETANYADNSETYMAVTPNDSDMYLGTASSENFNCHLRFFNLRRTNVAKGFEVISGAYRSSDSYWVSWYQGIGFDHNNFTDKNFITFFLSSGNITSGTVKLFGLNL